MRVAALVRQASLSPFIRGGRAVLTLMFTLALPSMAWAGVSSAFHEQYVDRELLQLSKQDEQALTPFQLGLLAFEANQYGRALEYWLPMAEAGYDDAQFYIGVMFEGGYGVQASPEIAVHWYEEAANLGNMHAQHSLAVAYAKGTGVEQDIQKAVYWWGRAATQGNADAQYNLGIVYATGKDGVKADITQAEKWWRLAAVKGDAMAQYNLGALYVNTSSDNVRYCEAEQWWRRSAEGGFAQADHALQVLRARSDFNKCSGH